MGVSIEHWTVWERAIHPKIIFLNMVAHRNVSRKEREVSKPLQQSPLWLQFAVSSEPHKELCPPAATKQLSIISLKHTPKKMMQINQSRRNTHALETKTQCFQMQCPLAIRSSVAKEMVTRHRCLESSRISGGVVLDSLLIPFWLTSWKKAFQIFHFSCVCVGKKGLCYVTGRRTGSTGELENVTTCTENGVWREAEVWSVAGAT